MFKIVSSLLILFGLLVVGCSPTVTTVKEFTVVKEGIKDSLNTVFGSSGLDTFYTAIKYKDNGVDTVFVSKFYTRTKTITVDIKPDTIVFTDTVEVLETKIVEHTPWYYNYIIGGMTVIILITFVVMIIRR